jgi:hypothetical protein
MLKPQHSPIAQLTFSAVPRSDDSCHASAAPQKFCSPVMLASLKPVSTSGTWSRFSVHLGDFGGRCGGWVLLFVTLPLALPDYAADGGGDGLESCNSQQALFVRVQWMLACSCRVCCLPALTGTLALTGAAATA